MPAGGFAKPCNTTGTATNGGYPEATFAWQVSQRLVRSLRRLGARVIPTRTVNSEKRWGPCVDRRGRAGNKIGAHLKISIHADGAHGSGARGFHVIAPSDRRPWTHDIFRASKHLAALSRTALIARRFPVANYIAGGDGLDFRSDPGTLNLSDVPAVMVELGTMRNRDEAQRMSSRNGRAAYASALRLAVRAFLAAGRPPSRS